jgi:hypothetical protein
VIKLVDGSLFFLDCEALRRLMGMEIKNRAERRDVDSYCGRMDGVLNVLNPHGLIRLRRFRWISKGYNNPKTF